MFQPAKFRYLQQTSQKKIKRINGLKEALIISLLKISWLSVCCRKTCFTTYQLISPQFTFLLNRVLSLSFNIRLCSDNNSGSSFNIPCAISRAY